MKTTWREAIESERIERKDGPIIACTLTDEQLDKPFDCGYGGTCGQDFTAWSEQRVYFPGCYDGAEWCSSAPRHPCDEAMSHVGGG